jgi:RNA polymerase sigma factor (sigma-70 family)
MTDSELVLRVRSGETDAFSRLVDRHGGRLYVLALRWLGHPEDAQDAAQDAFIQAYVRLEQLRDPERFGPWLGQLALNVCRGRLRARKPTVPMEQAAEVAGVRPEADPERVATRLSVEGALAVLSPALRETFCLFYEENRPVAEIAALQRIPVATVKSRLRDGRRRLRRELSGGDDPRPRAPEGFTGRVMALLRAAREGDLPRVRRLLRSGPKLVAARDGFGNSALTEALNAGHDAVAEALFERGARLDLHAAAAAGVTGRVQEILEHDPHLLDSLSAEGFTPLSLAAHFGHLETVRFLLDRGAAADQVATHVLQVTPLHAALFGRRVEVALLLLERGASVGARRGGRGLPREGWTALHYAAAYGLMPLIAPLLRRGADPAARDAEGRTPLDQAREAGHDEIARLLAPASAAASPTKGAPE